MTEAKSPYLLDEPPTSAGKALLSRAFAQWCAVHHGYSPEEIVDALDADAPRSEQAVREIGFAARIVGEIIAGGAIRTYARPYGGGVPRPLTAEDWELDDFRTRIGLSAIDPDRPYAPDAAPTHWIFVHLEDFNTVIEDSCCEVRPASQSGGDENVKSGLSAVAAEPARTIDRLVRLPEVRRMTGMSRSTIYRRIEEGRFPAQIPIDGNIAAWRESEVATWLADPS